MTFNKVQWSCGGFCGFCVQALCKRFDPQPQPQRPQSSAGIFISTPALIWFGGQVPEHGYKNGSHSLCWASVSPSIKLEWWFLHLLKAALRVRDEPSKMASFQLGSLRWAEVIVTLMKLEIGGKEAQDPWIPFPCMLWRMELLLVPDFLRSRIQEIKTWKLNWWVSFIWIRRRITW